jgi:hypothetical protein
MIASVKRCWSTGARVVSLLALSTSWVHASGFAIDNQGTRAMGFAGAYVAQASDPSAIFYNAAGVAFLKGQQIYVSGGLGSYATSFTGEGPEPSAGTRENRTASPCSRASITRTRSRATWSSGLSFNAPFGAKSVAEPQTVHRPLHLHRLRDPLVGPQPTLAYKLEPARGGHWSRRPLLELPAEPAPPRQSQSVPGPPRTWPSLTVRAAPTRASGSSVGLWRAPRSSCRSASPTGTSAGELRRHGGLQPDPHRQRGGGRGGGRQPASQPRR